MRLFILALILPLAVSMATPAWAEDTATRANPDALWQDLEEKDLKIAELEMQIANLRGDLEEIKGSGGTGLRRPPPNEPDEEAREIRRRLEGKILVFEILVFLILV